jgi:hypothetical protein
MEALGATIRLLTWSVFSGSDSDIRWPPSKLQQSFQFLLCLRPMVYYPEARLDKRRAIQAAGWRGAARRRGERGQSQDPSEEEGALK